MSLTPGTRLGPYEITALIGAGGMGEVYKARDTRLDRAVAIKVLSPEIASDAQFRERFEREARTISALEHPHICSLYDVGEQDGTSFFVMQYLDGETLAQRLARGTKSKHQDVSQPSVSTQKDGPLSLHDSLRIATDIADALDAAHRLGITHRDLKPGNIMLTRSGGSSGPATAKLLDFGLAKTVTPIGHGPAGSKGLGLGDAASTLPTAQATLTVQGTILGTFQYMAPEQFEGKEADARTDIFAFGALLYEMVTGRKAFEGKSQASLMGAIMHAEPPPMSALQPLSPPGLDRLVTTCLAKDPAERWQTMHDLLLQLRWMIEPGGATTAAVGGLQSAPTTVSTRRVRRERMAWALVALFALIAAGVGAWSVMRPPVTSTVSRLMVGLGQPPLDMANDVTTLVAISPDGNRLVYACAAAGISQLCVRSIAQFDAAPLRGTDGASLPFFSPDSQWIAFFANGKLKKIAATGGAPVVLADAPNSRGGSWGSDDAIVFASTASSPLARVSSNGGQAVPLTTIDTKGGESSHRWPDVLPGGDGVLYMTTLVGVNAEAMIAVHSRQTGKSTMLVAGTQPRYVSSGHLVFARGASLFAAPFDLKRLTVTGPAVPAVEGVATQTSGAAHFSVSATGTLLYVPGKEGLIHNSLVWVDRKGTVEPLKLPMHGYELPRFSPDGRRVAVTIRDNDPDVWIYEMERGTLTRLTFEVGEDESPVWTPDGHWITFASSRVGQPRQTLRKLADGSGAEERLEELGGRHHHLGSWSSDGQALAYTRSDAASGNDLFVLPGKGGAPTRPFVVTPFGEHQPMFSPDGHVVAYTSDESGRREVYVRAYPGPGGKWQISTEGGAEPMWSRTGRELFYRMGDKMMVVAVEAQPTFKAATPRVLFEGRFTRVGWNDANYDVSPDGQRFLMVRGQEQATPTDLHVVLNWFEDLRARARTK